MAFLRTILDVINASLSAIIQHLLRNYLPENDILEALRASLCKDGIVLNELKFKADALSSWKLPFTLKASFIDTVTLKVSWNGPWIVIIDRVFILATHKEDKEKLFEAELQEIEKAVSATLKAISKSKAGSALNPSSGSSWQPRSLFATIIGNLKISITNVHIRYEDSVSNSGHPFCMGVTLAKLAAFTIDEQRNETFDNGGALDTLWKSSELVRLALYHDSDSVPWEKAWKNLTPNEWAEIFEDGIREPADDRTMVSEWAMNRKYLVSPINGVLKYHRLGKQETNDPGILFEEASVVLSDVSVTVTEAQYRDWMKLLGVVSRYKRYVECSYLRPEHPVSVNRRLWWRYAAQAGLRQKKRSNPCSWDCIQHHCKLRRRYIPLYVRNLHQFANAGRAKMREIEKDLDSEVILLFRLLAHAKDVKFNEDAKQRTLQKKSWFPFTWFTPDENSSERSEFPNLSKEEWQAITKLLSYQPDETLTSQSGKDTQDMIGRMVTMSIEQATARIVDLNDKPILCCKSEGLQVSTKFKHQITHWDVSLILYCLNAPEGSLAQSIFNEKKVNALVASLIFSPVGENVDRRLSATISPCHVTLLMESYDHLLDFVKRCKAVSPTIALQKKIKKVTHRAKEQFQMVLEEQSRFALDIDFDAPKVRVPIRSNDSSKYDSHFLLDFGHFTVKTKDCQYNKQKWNLYSRFLITGSDIEAFFKDCDSNCPIGNVAPPVGIIYPLIDRCGMAVLVDQVKVPHPDYPSMCISIQVPNLGIHFSPRRFEKLMKLLNIMSGTLETVGQLADDNFQAQLTPRSSADLHTDARVWMGIDNSVAIWQPCFIVLSGTHIFVLESEKSQSYQLHMSMAGREICEVPQTSVGGSPFCLAVIYRGMDTQKALESSSSLIIEFHGEEEKAIWFQGLEQATYRASTSNSKTPDLVINGALVETKLSIHGKTGDKHDEEIFETLMLEVLASGGQVHLIGCKGDLTLETKLHSFKIKDVLQGHLSTAPQYLACSVLKNDDSFSAPIIVDPHWKEMFALLDEEDDTFTDALPYFMPLPDSPIEDTNEEDETFTDAFPDFMSLTDSGFPSPTEDTNDDAGCTAPEGVALEKITMKSKCILGEVFCEAEGSDSSNFVSVTFLTRSSSSPDYEGIDTQMSLRMSKLEIFCNRPTLVALIDFGLDLSSVYSVGSTADIIEVAEQNSLINKGKTEENCRVNGSVGYGYRVLFYSNLNVSSVTVFLNKEDGSTLATIVQESFVLDLKVHQSSLYIEGTLGNFSLLDMSLGEDHCWAWLCDTHKPDVESLIKFNFSSYSDEDDFKGYDYSLRGQLSGIRIVFLYRFVQEITAYFMELATPLTDDAIKVVDEASDFEWLIPKYEVDGASALKLDLVLDTAIIFVPRDSTSNDFIRLGLDKLEITNEFSWHGSPEQDLSAVHIDVLHASIPEIKMSVGIDGCVGKSEVCSKNLDVYVRRSLRDIFRKLPTFCLEVNVSLLHGLMSDNEYKVILDCVSTNLLEEPNIPRSFRGGQSDFKDKVNVSEFTIVGVVIDEANLNLCNAIHAEALFAQITLKGLWVSYRMTSLTETDLYMTISQFSVVDSRPGTEPEMSRILGSSTNACNQPSSRSSFLNRRSLRRTDCATENLPITSMFSMDYKCRTTTQELVIRIQQPRVLIVADFLLAVGEFFVRASRSVTGREEVADPKNDPIGKSSSIVFTEPVYTQTEDVVHLSPSRQLVADFVSIDEYTYDGCGNTICLSEGSESNRSRPIIIIGRGKKLLFTNVKIKNGCLLSKYTYMSNDSSYSLADSVDITLLENYSSYDDKTNPKSPSSSSISSYSETDPNKMPSFLFETQVVSPEFTFFDGSKSSLDDSYGEKLLRAKMDFRFTYASEENNTCIRSLVKDLTVEAGCGLIVLDPVDIYGIYTSDKDKTNMSFSSTDIHFHLSLSAISLISNLQSQATAALLYGNSVPLAPCTNFDRICVSSKDNGSFFNLTFWRPQAPSNYVILGDCVTSRPIPPSQAVMSLSNTYGRVCKPTGFKFIASFSAIPGFTGGDSDVGIDCSLWMPVAPPGYTSLGCVANFGKESPPNHIVYCIRSDLVTSTTYSECLFSCPSNQQMESGFSIWRVENVLGSFYAHSSTECPSQDNCFTLNHLLIWNSSRHHSSANESTSGMAVGENHGTQETRNLARSLSKATKCYMSTPNLVKIWSDNSSGRPVSIWRPIPDQGYAVLGDCIAEGFERPAVGIIFRADDRGLSANPVHFIKVAHLVERGVDEAFIWYPIAPSGYVSLGCIVSRDDVAPCKSLLCCPRSDLVNNANILEGPISRSLASKGSQCWSIWRFENEACTFFAHDNLEKPSSELAYAIVYPMKPEDTEKINVELELSCLSVTVLDSLCGMMTPLFNARITDIKLKSHGRVEAMNAVLISSIAASTFNTHLKEWEPLVEPFDGKFKFETFDTNLHSPSEFGKSVRIAATRTLNINVSAANIETFVGGILSWRKQLILEQKARRLNVETCGFSGQGDDQTSSALGEDEFQTLIVENKLGCEIYLKIVERNPDSVDRLNHGDCISVCVPPPQFSDRLNVADESKESPYYVAIQIHEAKGLPVVDDGNSHKFLCALRLAVGSLETDKQIFSPQSARTNCVKPSVLQNSNLNVGTVQWNERFIFEVPRKGTAELQVEVTNLAAKAGKDEVVGALSLVMHPGHDIENSFFQLKREVKHDNLENLENKNQYGLLLVSTSYYERKTSPSQRHLENENVIDRDVGFYVGLSPEGVCHSIRSLLPLSVVPILLQNDFIALEVMLKNGKKHAIFRGLATVVNETDVKLKVCICSFSLVQAHDSSLGTCENNNHLRNVFSAINPGESIVLPWRSTSTDSDQCLQICLFHNHQCSCSWGSVTAVGSGYAYGKDMTVRDQISPSRQYTSKEQCKMPNVTLKLNQLEKKDILLCCSRADCLVDKQCWLSVGADASVLHTELNHPVNDWRISVNSPLKLENRLPCLARFTIWEKKKGNFIQRETGTVSSLGGDHIYSADIQKPIYLTLVVQDWVMEKEHVLVLDPSDKDHVSSFWMFHCKSERKLLVCIERDMGRTTAAPKIIRFFVPYWIINDSSVPLAYKVEEVEPSDNVDMDSPISSGESAKRALKFRTSSMERKHSAAQPEVLEDTSPYPSMLSPQDYNPGKDVYPFSRVGLSVAIRHSDNYSPGISLHELENKERLDVKAFSSNGSYYKLSARMNMTSDITKVVHFQPHTLFVNRVGYSLCLQQCDSQSLTWIQPNESPIPFCWQSGSGVEMLKLRVDGYKWSAPFSISNKGIMRVCLRKVIGYDQLQLRIEVRSGAENSSLEVVFRPNSSSSPYRIENRSTVQICTRQADSSIDSWTYLYTNSATSFLWEDLGRPRLLEIMVEFQDGKLEYQKYDIDKKSDYQPIMVGSRGVCVSITKEDRVNVVNITDWMPESEPTEEQQQSTSTSPFHIILELAELGISFIDHTPEEIMYLSIQNLLFKYSTLGSGLSRFDLKVCGIQLDNQLLNTQMPVLLKPQPHRVGEEMKYILTFSVTKQSNGSLDLCVYPYIGLHVPENSAFLMNIHEPIIWRVHELIQQVNLSRLCDTQTAVSMDPVVHIGVLDISKVPFVLSMAMSSSHRPRDVLGFWPRLISTLVNTENIAVRMNQRLLENACMRQSSLINIAISNIKKDLLRKPLQLLTKSIFRGVTGMFTRTLEVSISEDRHLRRRQPRVIDKLLRPYEEEYEAQGDVIITTGRPHRDDTSTGWDPSAFEYLMASSVHESVSSAHAVGSEPG